jgi:hypothetical protein
MSDITPISTDAHGVASFIKQEVTERLVPEPGAPALIDSNGDCRIDATDTVRLSKPLRKLAEKRTTLLKKSVKTPQELEAQDTVAQQKLQRGENPRLANTLGNSPQIQAIHTER